MKTTRNTVRKRSAAQPTQCAKVLESTGRMTPVELLVADAIALRAAKNDPRPPSWVSEHLDRMETEMKWRFADLLFPALLEDKPGELSSLVEIMARFRPHGPRSKLSKGADKTGHRRRALLVIFDKNHIQPRTWAELLGRLHMWGVKYDDQASLIEDLRLLNISFKPRR